MRGDMYTWRRVCRSALAAGVFATNVCACSGAPSTPSPIQPPTAGDVPPIPSPAGGVWSPAMSTSWQWQLTGLPVDETIDADMYDIDLF